MAEHEIPPPFRSLFGGPALDEPKPPAPPDAEDDGDDDDDGHHFHVHVQMTVPKVLVLSDGSVRSDGWGGTLLVGWGWLASASTVALALWAAWAWRDLAYLALSYVLTFSVVAIVAMVALWLVVTVVGRVSLKVTRWIERRKASVQP